MASTSGPAPGAPAVPATGPLRVIFLVRPFRGHLHPLIPLARAFRRQGHRVAVATAEDMATVVTGAGLIWLPAGSTRASSGTPSRTRTRTTAIWRSRPRSPTCWRSPSSTSRPM